MRTFTKPDKALIMNKVWELVTGEDAPAMIDGFMFFTISDGKACNTVYMTEAQIVSVVAQACEADLDVYNAILRGCIRGGMRRGMKPLRYIHAK